MMGTYIIPQNESELYHYGVLGMKWGVRRYQSYDEKPRGSGKGGTELGEAKKVSKKKQKIIDSYKEAGMSDAEAEAAYAKRQKIKKIVGVALGVGLTAAAAYVVYRGISNTYVDRVIPKGAVLQNMSAVEDKMTLNADNSDFYAAYKGLDKLKYRGLFGAGKTKYETAVQEGMKVASHNTAKKEFVNLFNDDPAFKIDVRNAIDDPSAKAMMLINHKYKGLNYARVYNKFMKGNKLTPKEQNALYDIYSTVGFLNNSAQGQMTKNTLYDVLKEKGYQAVVDFNDTSSGLRTNHPVIVFDTSKLGKVSSSEYSTNVLDIVGGKIAGYAGAYAAEPLTYAAVGVGVTSAALNGYDRKVKDEALMRKYYKQNNGGK